MSVNVSKFAKKKENSSSVTVNNSSRGYSNTNNNYTASQLDRMLWNIHDIGQDINESLTLPALSVNGQITAGGRITGNSGLTIVGDSYMNGDVRITGDLNVDNKITAYAIEAVTGNITYLNSYQGNITNLISTNITTDYLNVTKSAHFAELIIDKIKAAGGSVILTCADGFKIESEDDIIKMPAGYYMLCWNAKDDRAETINMWERGDQALCMNFNDARVGVQTDVNNVYYWGVVYDAGTFDPEEHTEIRFNDSNYMNNTSSSVLAKHEDNTTNITFTDKKHWIIVREYSNSDGPISITDADGNEGPCYDDKGGISYIKPGNEIVMLGHRPTGSNDDVKRSNAIYLAAYDKGIEAELKAPFIAQYMGITDFDLTSHKTTYFSAGNNSNYGVNNHVKGSFEIDNIEDFDIDVTTFFITCDRAYIPVSSSYYLNSSYNVNVDCKYIKGNIVDYIGNNDSDYCLRIYYDWPGNTGQPQYVEKEKSFLTTTYTFDLWDLIRNYTSGAINKLWFEICKVNGYSRETVCSYTIPVIPEAGGQPGLDGTDGEMYKFNTIREQAQINTAGDFILYLQYSVIHIIGDTQETVDNSTRYKVRFYLPSEDNNGNHNYHVIPYREESGDEEGASYSSGIYTYNRSESGTGSNRYYDTGVFDKEGTGFDLSNYDSYLTVELYDTTNNKVLDSKVIPVTLLAGALLKVTDSILGRVTSTESTLTEHTTKIGQLELDSEKFTTDIASINTVLNSYGGDIESLETNYSYIHQYADSISTRVENTRTEFNNAYSYITSNYSTIDQTAEQISLYVNSYGVSQDQLKRTGIDITSYNITLNGNTIINGQLDLNSGEGFNLNNEDGSLGAKIHGGEIPDYDDWISLTTSDLAKKVERDETFTNIGTSRTFTVDFSGDDKIDLGLKYSGDNFIFKEIAFRTFVILTACTVTAKLYRGTTLVKTINGTLSADVYDRWKYTLNDTYNITTNGNYYMTLTFTCTGTPNFETCYVKGLVYLDTQINNLTEIGSNGIGQRNDTENYNYFSSDITEARHGGGGLSVKDNEALYLGFNKTSGINNNEGLTNYSWRSINSINSTLVTSENYICTKDDCLLIVSPPTGKNSITITLPSSGYNGQLLYIRRLTGTNITLKGTIYDINNGSITTKNLFTITVLNNVNIIPYFATLVYDGSRWIILDISGYYFTNIQ